jgi:hypothetical protein
MRVLVTPLQKQRSRFLIFLGKNKKGLSAFALEAIFYFLYPGQRVAK